MTDYTNTKHVDGVNKHDDNHKEDNIQSGGAIWSYHTKQRGKDDPYVNYIHSKHTEKYQQLVRVETSDSGKLPWTSCSRTNVWST